MWIMAVDAVTLLTEGEVVLAGWSMAVALVRDGLVHLINEPNTKLSEAEQRVTLGLLAAVALGSLVLLWVRLGRNLHAGHLISTLLHGLEAGVLLVLVMPFLIEHGVQWLARSNSL